MIRKTLYIPERFEGAVPFDPDEIDPEPRRVFGPLCWSMPDVYSYGFSRGYYLSTNFLSPIYHLWVAGAFRGKQKSWKGINHD